MYKKLKDAGFPQKKKNGFIYSHINDPSNTDNDEVVYVPTLSELIDACGGDFKPFKISYLEGGRKIWLIFDATPDVAVWGDTPEEAVARLWLELNK